MERVRRHARATKTMGPPPRMGGRRTPGDAAVATNASAGADSSAAAAAAASVGKLAVSTEATKSQTARAPAGRPSQGVAGDRQVASANLAPAAGVLNEATDVVKARGNNNNTAPNSTAAAAAPATQRKDAKGARAAGKKADAGAKENAAQNVAIAPATISTTNSDAAVGGDAAKAGKPAKKRASRGGRRHRERKGRIAERQAREQQQDGDESDGDDDGEEEEEEVEGSEAPKAGTAAPEVSVSADVAAAPTPTEEAQQPSSAAAQPEPAEAARKPSTTTVKRVARVVPDCGSERVVLPGTSAEDLSVTVAFGAMELSERCVIAY